MHRCQTQEFQWPRLHKDDVCLAVTGYFPPRWRIINYGNILKASFVYLGHIMDIGVVDEWGLHTKTTEQYMLSETFL